MARDPAAPLDAVDRHIINALHGGFPLTDEPYRDVAESLGIAEDDLLARIDRMLRQRVLTRFGPMFQVERIGGRFVLAAMKVPDADFDRVAAAVNALPEVAHNYRRDHVFNMWFVLASERPDGIPAAIMAIECATGLPVFAFPKEHEYFVEMKLRA